MDTHTPRWRNEPIELIDGIPVFSRPDRYVENYMRIAVDHLAAMKPEADNPFIENELWIELERSTRDLIDQYVPDGSTILDVGVGLGRVLAPLSRLKRYGIDISLDYLKKAQAAGIATAYARIEDMPFVDQSFDAIVTCDVLEHVIDLHACVVQILRVLKPGGHLIVRVPYREDLKVYLQEGLPYEFIHLRNFDESSVRLFFQKIHGCEVLEIKTVAPYWQGETRLRFRPPAQTEISRLLQDKTLPANGLGAEGAQVLKSLASISEEALTAWINKIKQDAPALFKAIAPYLILDIEMNVVIRKPI